MDAELPLPHLADGDAGKSAGRGRVGPEQDASCLRASWHASSAPQDGAAELCTQGAARSAEQSYAALEAAAGLQLPEALPDAARRAVPEWQKKQQPKAPLGRMAQA